MPITRKVSLPTSPAKGFLEAGPIWTGPMAKEYQGRLEAAAKRTPTTSQPPMCRLCRSGRTHNCLFSNPKRPHKFALKQTYTAFFTIFKIIADIAMPAMLIWRKVEVPPRAWYIYTVFYLYHYGGILIKQTYTAFFTVFMIGSLLCGIARSSPMLIIGRGVLSSSVAATLARSLSGATLHMPMGGVLWTGRGHWWGYYSGVGWDIAEGGVELAEVSLGMVRILTGAWWLDDMVVVVT